MEIKTLEHTNLNEVHEVFIEAFKDYEIRTSLTYDSFLKMLIRKGYSKEYSVGAFDQERLVGFVLNAKGFWNQESCFYNLGTGVIQSHRGQGLSSKLLKLCKKLMSQYHIHLYLLEVLVSNEQAYHLYLSEGFSVSRTLKCYKGKSRGTFDSEVIVESLHEEHLNLEIVYGPSWQNSIDSLLRVKEDYKVFLLKEMSVIKAYAIVNLQTGDFAQVHFCDDTKGFRLIKHIQNVVEDKHLSFVNVDEAYHLLIDLLDEQRLDNFINQYEMIYELKE